jgi:hypothetical protein
VLEPFLGPIQVAAGEVDLGAEGLRKGNERRHASRLGFVQCPVQRLPGGIDLPAEEVEASEERERQAERLTRREPLRAREGGWQELPGRRVVTDVVGARASNERHPGQLALFPVRELGGASQRVLCPIVVRTQELDPADLPPAGRRHVGPAGVLGDERAFVERSRALLVSAADRGVDQSAAQGDQCPRQERGVVDVPGGRNGAEQPLEADSTAPAASAASPASTCASAAALPETRASADSSYADAAERRAGVGSMPRSRRKSSEQAWTCLVAPSRSPAARRQRTRRTWAFSSYGLRRTSSDAYCTASATSPRASCASAA